jgi:SM-20-related protein
MIRLFDNVLPAEDQERLLAFLMEPGWSYGAYSDPAPDASRYWYKHFAGYFRDGESRELTDIVRELDRFPLLRDLWERLRAGVLAGHRLTRCYANAYPAGSEGGLHRDSLEPGHYTVIYYPHLRWSPNYAGETLFFNDEGSEIVAAVYPRPNRLAVFEGSMWHVARGVSRRCPELRVTLMFKTAIAAAAPAGFG